MKIVKIEDLHADGGWRNFSFLKLVTDDGLVGWSEYAETSWSPGLTAIIRRLGEQVIGKDPRAWGRIGADLRALTRMAPGGLADQAIAAIENACLDIAGKAADLPVHALFGGPVRDRLPLYWSHCGTFRASGPELFETMIGGSGVRSLDDIRQLGADVAAQGYTALKTNPIVFDGDKPRLLNPGFRPGLELGRNGDARTFEAIAQQLAAFRAGAGDDVDLLLDVNFGFSCEALRQLAQRLEPLGLFWLEADVHGPAALADVRRAVRTPIASLESIYRLKGYLPYFEAASADVAIVDVVWNGLPESLKIAATAEAFEVNVAPHNFYGHIASLISAHFAAVVPNLRIVEYEVDDVPWKDELVTHPPVIEAGQMLVPDRPGWGADVVEEAVKAHPPRG
jgi:L-alanine-DL-glutamate epimerase-like enolase superfamily enzyme